MKSWIIILPYFDFDELKCSCCGTIQLDFNFAAALVMLRHCYGHALYPTSICRCPDHNEAVGGHPNSLHLTENPVHETGGCAAIDIGWYSWPRDVKLKFAKLAWEHGWSIGLNKTFIHLDGRNFAPIKKLDQAIFLYSNWTYEFNQIDIDGEIL